MSFKDEKSYRLKVRELYEHVERSFDSVDPDIAEVELGQGTLTIQNPKGKIILSTQPSVQQLWLAAASIGKAVHFNFDENQGQWLDDKGEGLEVYAYLSKVIEQSTGLKVSF